MSCPLARSAVLAALSVWVCAVPVAAQVVNGSFEDPFPLNGWALGAGARVEGLQSTNFGPNTVAPPDGDWYALLSSGPGNIAAPNGDFDANGTNDFDGSTLSTTFTTVVADETFGFQWAFLTDELGPGGQGQGLYDDLFDITVNGISIVRGSVRKPGGSSPYADSVPYDNLRYTVNSPGLTDNSDFGTAAGGGRTPFQQVCVTIADPGTYSLEFLVADQGDSGFDSGLLIDAVETASVCDPTLQLTTSDQSIVEAKDGGLVFTTVTNGRAALSRDGATLTFDSNGNYAGDNPNLQDQIWIATRNGATFDVTRVTAAVNADFGTPGMSGDAQWLAFASTGDLVPSGNPDGNLEIFRYDRGSGTLLQITNTTGCTNEDATIADGGAAIVFVSDCDLGISASGSEVVLWDGTFRGVDTAGCISRDPRISRGDGRYVSFLTDCDGEYPGTSNPDGSLEILQWDTQNDLYLEVTAGLAGTLVEGLAASDDGAFLSFASNGDFEAGQNLPGNFVVFRYDRTTASFLQLVTPDPLALFTVTSVDGSGTFVAAERVDLLTGSFGIVLVDATLPGTEFPVAAGSATVSNNFPVVGIANNRPLVVFQSNGDTSGNNGDSNVEIWLSGAALDLPDQTVLCSTPNLAIPDNNNPGVADVITTSATGTLTDLDVLVRIEHTWVGDLRVQLRHVDSGTSGRIIDRPGRPPGAGCSGNDIDATLDDEAASSAENECVTPGPIAIDGVFTPNDLLNRFDGETLAGDWELRVSDRVNGNFGTLIEWCLLPSTQ